LERGKKKGVSPAIWLRKSEVEKKEKGSGEDKYLVLSAKKSSLQGGEDLVKKSARQQFQLGGI